MKIAVIDTNSDQTVNAEARGFLPKLLKGLTGLGNEVHLLTEDAPTENISAPGLNERNPDICLIWTADDAGWAVLPRLNPTIAALAVGHADAEIFYVPTRHYRQFLTRVIGTTPEVCVGFVLSCVIDKERVEWISYGELEGSGAETAEEEMQKVVETYQRCFEKAIADARAVPRETIADFPPLRSRSRPAESASWFSKLKAKIIK